MELTVESTIRKQPSTTITKRSILVIDDTADLLDLQKTILEMDGFEVFVAQSGSEAFNILTQINPPDLILLDVVMDDMNGPEFLDLLEKKMPRIMINVPIVFISGMEVVPEGRVVGLIQKPFLVEEFLNDVHRFIDMKQVDSKLSHV
jgi:two-component system response regulator CpxR